MTETIRFIDGTLDVSSNLLAIFPQLRVSAVKITRNQYQRWVQPVLALYQSGLTNPESIQDQIYKSVQKLSPYPGLGWDGKPTYSDGGHLSYLYSYRNLIQIIIRILREDGWSDAIITTFSRLDAQVSRNITDLDVDLKYNVSGWWKSFDTAPIERMFS